MGRAFEFRKARKMKRWAGMAKTFTRVGREIAIAVKSGGGNPEYNARLRAAISNGKAANMPKANIESAIKKALSKDSANYDEVTFEGYAPHGIAVMVEASSDNNNRTVANVRHVFSKYGGQLGTTGSVEFMFTRISVFNIKKEAVADPEELEMELIDAGLEEMKFEDDMIVLNAAFTDFGTMQSKLEEMGIEISSSSFERIPSHTKKLTDEQVEEVVKLIEKMEEDDDVATVFHNMDEED